MNDIRPIQITETIITTQGWACDKCDKTYLNEKAARNHRASHTYTGSHFLGGTNLFRFESEYDFTYWKQYGLFSETGGIGGPWQGAGWYLIDWKGDEGNEYASLEPAEPTLTRRLNDAEYEYRQAQEALRDFATLDS